MDQPFRPVPPAKPQHWTNSSPRSAWEEPVRGILPVGWDPAAHAEILAGQVPAQPTSAGMTDASLQSVDQAVNRLSLTDPIVKLLHEVKLGRMKPTDAGLCAITESWLETYRQVLETTNNLDQTSVRRLDPSPRLDVLIDAGVLTTEHPSVHAVRAAFERRLTESTKGRG
jgi:hypothetical protein